MGEKRWLSLGRGGRLFITPSDEIFDILIGQYAPGI